jgi:hypothetical protein
MERPWSGVVAVAVVLVVMAIRRGAARKAKPERSHAIAGLGIYLL